jgi:hypothetical protein
MSEYPFDHWWEIGTRKTRAWTVAGTLVEAERMARYMRQLHPKMSIAFPLPIVVWAVRDIPHGTSRKRIRGPWERRCRCCEEGKG